MKNSGHIRCLLQFVGQPFFATKLKVCGWVALAGRRNQSSIRGTPPRRPASESREKTSPLPNGAWCRSPSAAALAGRRKVSREFEDWFRRPASATHSLTFSATRSDLWASVM